MKTLRLAIAVIFIIFISSYSFATEGGYSIPGNKSASLNNLISMDFQDANLKTVLKIFSQQSGLNFVAGQSVESRTITVYFDNVTVEDALNHIMNANNLVYEQAPGSNIFIVRESGKPEIETITKIYELKYAQLVSETQEEGGAGTETGTEEEIEIIEVIKSVLSENGKVVADKRSNSLIITDVPNQFRIVEEVLARLDVRASQVMIEAEIIETTTALVENLGINWSGTFGVYTGSNLTTRWPLKGALIDKDLIGTQGSFAMSGMTATLYALLDNTDTKVLARPKILTMNNEVAKIELSSKEVARQYTETATSNDVTTSGTVYEEKDTGVILEVTPQISKDGYITMHLKPNITSLILSRYANQYDTHTRSTDTTVMVKDGETVVIGGLIKSTNSHSFKKVPFLGNIPFIGAAFRYKTKDDEDRELLIFITPYIKKETMYALGNISEREQENPKAVKEKEIKSLLDLLGEGR